MDAVAQLGTGIAFGPLGRSSAMTGSLSGSAVDIRAEIEILFTRHHGEIYAYLARMTREPELAGRGRTRQTRIEGRGEPALVGDHEALALLVVVSPEIANAASRARGRLTP